ERSLMPGPIPLELTGLSKTFQTPDGPFVAVDNVNAIIHEGEFICILGHSGCGKSTVLSIIAGLQRATLGGVVIDGTEVDEPGADRAVVFQSPCLLPWLTARRNVALAMKQRRGRDGRTKVLRHTVTDPPTTPEGYLELVGVADCADQLPGQLS